MSFIGIDVAKAQLEFACRPGGETGGVPNEERGITELVVRCRTLAPTLIVCEATGGYAPTGKLGAHGIATQQEPRKATIPLPGPQWLPLKTAGAMT